ncbi:Pentatricopeptide repeat-containing protein [Vitis vinifera]|uniref:Pentatricopeptide repeat-containing protein n=1 Tax=Vitis vinifera TaxID=29760 RepID=A0A438EZK6_VITVI|nr:Pentatricopeptide repeat-containing protein [Vitis vinifera]
MGIGYSRNGYPKEALLLYYEMVCQFGQLGVKATEDPDQVVNNALLRLYSEDGCFEEALRMFDGMPHRNLVSWNSLIAGLVKKEGVFEAIEAFRIMQGKGMGGKEIHAVIVKSTAKPDAPVLNSLVDMYAKCGAMDYCRRVFNGMQGKDLTSWNTLITGYAINGRMTEAMESFQEMICSGFSPDGITFIALLSGCSHAGLADDGCRLFEMMKMDHGISPTVEHYACLVDVLGRAGRIKEALEIVKNMPFKPTGSIWGSLLNSCRLHGNVPLAEAVAKRLFELEPNNAGNYVMLSNIYANAGMWESVKVVREFMEKRGMTKEAGCSWLQIKSKIHTFVAGGSNEFRNSVEYKKVWKRLMEAMEEVGYVPDTGVVLHDVSEEMRAMWVCGHSERLATMFALINTASGMPIRITKNLRVCVDCHSWVKTLSKVTGRVIVLRDTNRFHHFKDGVCSCKDYW